MGSSSSSVVSNIPQGKQELLFLPVQGVLWCKKLVNWAVVAGFCAAHSVASHQSGHKCVGWKGGQPPELPHTAFAKDRRCT